MIAYILPKIFSNAMQRIMWATLLELYILRERGRNLKILLQTFGVNSSQQNKEGWGECTYTHIH